MDTAILVCLAKVALASLLPGDLRNNMSSGLFESGFGSAIPRVL